MRALIPIPLGLAPSIGDRFLAEVDRYVRGRDAEARIVTIQSLCGGEIESDLVGAGTRDDTSARTDRNRAIGLIGWSA